MNSLSQLLLIAAFLVIITTEAAPTASQIEGVYFGALVADALCLGSHYEYDAKKIKQAYGGPIGDTDCLLLSYPPTRLTTH